MTPGKNEWRSNAPLTMSDSETGSLVHTDTHLRYGIVKREESSLHTLCCGYNTKSPFLEVQVTRSRDNGDISVTSSGSFPCLHIALGGLQKHVYYYLTMDFVEAKVGAGNKLALVYKDPYYIPRPNWLNGEEWMLEARYFNLATIFNGWLEGFGATLKQRGEYVPTVRIVEYPDGDRRLTASVSWINLPASTFIVTWMRDFLSGLPRPERRFLLELKSEKRSPSREQKARAVEAAKPKRQQPKCCSPQCDRSWLPVDMPYRTSTPIPLCARPPVHNDPANFAIWTPPGEDNRTLLGVPIPQVLGQTTYSERQASFQPSASVPVVQTTAAPRPGSCGGWPLPAQQRAPLNTCISCGQAWAIRSQYCAVCDELLHKLGHGPEKYPLSVTSQRPPDEAQRRRQFWS